MKYILVFLVLVIIKQSYSQCNSTNDEMLLIGDSWAFFSWSGDSYNENFDRFGLSDINCYSTSGLAVNGAEASDYFDDPARKQELIDYITTNPNLKIVHLSLGGNDAMGNWNKTMTSQQEDAILSVIMNDIKAIIDTIWFYNPNLDIHISGYDYPNFEETIGGFLIPSLHPFYGTWNNMGQPTNAEINGILSKASQAFADSAAAWDKVTFVNNLGLMQWNYGQTSPLTVAPYGTYQPFTAPVPGGYPDYPSPLDALNFGGNDSFHLNNNAYELFIKRHFEQFYWDYFRPKDTTFKADNSTNNGWTTLTNFNNDKLQVGNDASSNQVQAILSFDTHLIPNDKNAAAASIFIKRTSLMGSNLQPENLMVSITSSNFGDNIGLDTNDFNDFGEASAICCTYGTVDQDGFWMRIDLDPILLPYINRWATTQIKLVYNIADTDRYFEFSNDINDIQLDVTYQTAPLSVNEVESNTDISIYPNPANDEVTITNVKPNTQVTIFDLNGKAISQEILNGNQSLSINYLQSGIYFIRIKTEKGIVVKKLVKE